MVIGRIIREVRQRRGETPAAFAVRARVSAGIVRLLEDEGRGVVVPSRKRTAEMRKGPPRGGTWKHPDDRDRLLAFLESELQMIGVIVVDAHVVAPTAGAPAHSTAPRAATPVARTPSVAERLRAFIAAQSSVASAARALGLPKQTVGDAIHSKHQKPATLARIAAALNRVAAPTPGAPAAPAAAAPTDDRAALEQRIADLERTVRAIAPHVTSPPRDDGTTGDASDAEAIGALQRTLRAAAAGLERAAAIADDGERWRIKERLICDVEELFLQIDAFLRDHPSGASETIAMQRRYFAEYRARRRTHDGDSGAERTGGAT